MMNVQNLSSNWKKLQATLKANNSESTQSTSHGLKRKRQQGAMTREKPTVPSKIRHRNMNVPKSQDLGSGSLRTEGKELVKIATLRDAAISNQVNAGFAADVEISRYLAIDCEMVGVGPNPDLESILARVSIVNYHGIQVYDSYVLPQEEVTDWRTPVSGITLEHMKEARSFEHVQEQVAKILKDKIVVGHSVRNDFKALLLDHPFRDIRDTAKHQPYRDLAGGGSPKLKVLASQLLGLEIQTGEHSSIEDAKACMLLFRRDKDSFEREHAKNPRNRVNFLQIAANQGPANKTKSQTKKKRRKKKN